VRMGEMKQGNSLPAAYQVVRAPGRTDPPVVLLVEDFPDARDLYRLCLERDGLRVIEAATAREGLALARADRPDLIVMDGGLPDVSGWEAVKAIKADPDLAAIPALMLTVHVHEEARQRAIAAGAAGFIPKPCLPDDLTQQVLATLARAGDPRVVPADAGDRGPSARDGVEPGHDAPDLWRELAKSRVAADGSAPAVLMTPFSPGELAQLQAGLVDLEQLVVTTQPLTSGAQRALHGSFVYLREAAERGVLKIDWRNMFAGQVLAMVTSGVLSPKMYNPIMARAAEAMNAIFKFDAAD
jgi:two-component system, cell cycle response regulator DivK